MYAIKHWTKFEGRPHSAAGHTGTHVTLDPKGTIYLNHRAWDELGRPEAVEMFFDRERRVIGLKRCAAWQPNAFPLKARRGQGGKKIRASAFCMHFAIKTMRTARFNAVEIDDDGIMTLPLGSVTAVTTGAR